MELAEKIKDLRKAKNWTQAEAAKIIDIQQSYLSKLESGRNIPSPDVIEKLSAAYGVESRILMPKRSITKYNITLAILFVISFTLISTGLFATIYPDTFFTYRLTSEVQNSHMLPKLHFVTEYQGEGYIVNIEQYEYEYRLEAERKVSRVENRWLISSGLIMLLVSSSWAWLKRSNAIKNSSNASPQP